MFSKSYPNCSLFYYSIFSAAYGLIFDVKNTNTKYSMLLFLFRLQFAFFDGFIFFESLPYNIKIIILLSYGLRCDLQLIDLGIFSIFSQIRICISGTKGLIFNNSQTIYSKIMYLLNKKKNEDYFSIANSIFKYQKKVGLC